ncbi:MAG: ABC transporter permease [Bacteroidetes bacterium]|nr:MAG: ABC transporter permease [Bacteroidota bacterium]
MRREISALIKKDIQLELKQRYAINSILLYVVSTIFIAYMAFQGNIELKSWNALFWIIMLFSAINALSKSFVQESPARHIYYYSMSSPQAVIVSKTIYNSILMLIISLLTFGIYQLFLGNVIKDYPLFIGALVLGSFGFASILTLVAAIASRSHNNFALMSILSFPLVLPLLLSLMKASNMALEQANNGVEGLKLLAALFILNLIVITLSYILFPYLWRD